MGVVRDGFPEGMDGECMEGGWVGGCIHLTLLSLTVSRAEKGQRNTQTMFDNI